MPFLSNRPAYDVAVDLGTAFVRVFALGRGLVAEEPSLVRVRRAPLAVESVGLRAAEPHDGDPSISQVRPLQKGVVRDVDCAAWLLTPLLRRARGLTLSRPAVLAFAPTDATADEAEAVREALLRAGAARVSILPEPQAAAVGAGLDLASPYAQMLIDVGEGITDAVVIREGRILVSVAVRVGCADLRSAVADVLASSVGALAADDEVDLLIRRAEASSPSEALSFRAAERPFSQRTRCEPRAIRCSDVREAMSPVLDQIAGVARAAWSALSEQVSCEVIESGLCLTGGGANLHMVVERIVRMTSLDVRIPPMPMHAVITGASRIASYPLHG